MNSLKYNIIKIIIIVKTIIIIINTIIIIIIIIIINLFKVQLGCIAAG